MAATVLIADADADVREYLARLLRPEYRVVAVADGRAALATIRADPPDLVISDVPLPHLDGLALVTALRSDHRTERVPVLLLAAKAGPADVVAGLAAGADDYLGRPFDARELLARVRAHLRLARLRGHHADWRAALVDSLQEGFFVSDDKGTVVEVNEAFGDLLGYDADGLPYPAPQPWWPDATADAADHALVAGGVAQIIRTGLRELADQWQARRALAVLWGSSGQPTVLATDPDTAWTDLSDDLRDRLTRLRAAPPLHVDIATGTSPPLVRGAGTSVGYPDGDLVMWLDFSPAYRFDPAEQALLALLYAHIGQAAHRAHLFEQQREVRLALQRSILGPSALPDRFAVRYEPAGQPLEVGGDWYDVVDLTGGRIAVVVGDCVGRGITAAAVMGQLRSACRALLLHAGTPGQVLAALDDFARRVPGAACTTVFCGILDPATGVLAYSSAGHPPPILVHQDGATELLADGRFVPLTVLPGPRPDASATVPLGATLLLYTDGLVERRSAPIDVGIDGAAAILRDGSRSDVHALADRVMSGLAPDGGFDDDVAVLLYRRPAPLTIEFPATTDRLSPVRHELHRWLDGLRVATELAEDVVLVVGEACANAVEHGCRFDATRRVRLHGTVAAGRLSVTVHDPGAWRPASAESLVDRGRGLPLMRAVMDVELLLDQPGTTVTLSTAVRASACDA